VRGGTGSDQAMFQLFLRARAHKFFGDRATRRAFAARSVERDAEMDRQRVESIVSAIETALAAADAEHSGLAERVEDVLARASVTFGNDADEYLTREPLDDHHQSLFGAEISNGQRRLQELSVTITHLKFLKAATLSRFSDFKRLGSEHQRKHDQAWT
jgi:hypothetical protein